MYKCRSCGNVWWLVRRQKYSWWQQGIIRGTKHQFNLEISELCMGFLWVAKSGFVCLFPPWIWRHFGTSVFPVSEQGLGEGYYLVLRSTSLW